MLRFVTSLLAVMVASPVFSAEVFKAPPFEPIYLSAFRIDTVGEPIQPGQPVSFTDGPHFRIEGRIEPGDADKLQALLLAEYPDPNEALFNSAVVSLSSEGGDFYEGLRIADTIRRFDVKTLVAEGDVCLSSCAIAFMGGGHLELRGFPATPARYLHEKALVGFHAPFSELPSSVQVPDGTPLSSPLLSQLSDQFYGQAQAAISEIAGRMENWQMAPDFVFAFLGRGTWEGDARPVDERFVLIDRLERLQDTKARLLTSDMTRPTVVGLSGARGACDHVINDMSGLPEVFGGDRTVHYDAIGGSIPKPVPTGPTDIPKVVDGQLIPGSDENAFFEEGVLSGRGPVSCAVFQDRDGLWKVRTRNANFHEFGRPPIDAFEAIPVERFMTLGLTISWIKDDLSIFAQFRPLPEDLARLTGPSFDCGGELDPAAVVICAHPFLAAADGQMVELYKRARKRHGEIVRQDQRDWVAVRNKACRPELVDLSDHLAETSLARCLTMFTSARISGLRNFLQ